MTLRQPSNQTLSLLLGHDLSIIGTNSPERGHRLWGWIFNVVHNLFTPHFICTSWDLKKPSHYSDSPQTSNFKGAKKRKKGKDKRERDIRVLENLSALALIRDSR
jgi:hypothetical protein